ITLQTDSDGIDHRLCVSANSVFVLEKSLSHHRWTRLFSDWRWDAALVRCWIKRFFGGPSLLYRGICGRIIVDMAENADSTPFSSLWGVYGREVGPSSGSKRTGSAVDSCACLHLRDPRHGIHGVHDRESVCDGRKP